MKFFKKTKDKTTKELKTEIKLYAAYAIIVICIGFPVILFMFYNATSENLFIPLSSTPLILCVLLFYIIDMQEVSFELRLREAIAELKKDD